MCINLLDVSMRTFTLKDGKFILQDEIDEISEGVVKRIGNGGMIMSSKKYIGRKAYVLIRKEK
jgi:putative transposon-encoded protein